MHCSIEYCSERQRYMVKDHASQAGTYVNNKRLSKVTYSWGPSQQQLGVILTSCLNANVSAPSGPLSLRDGLLIFRIVCLVTLLIFLHSLHLSTQLKVSTSVISSTLQIFACWYCEFDVCSYVFISFIFYFSRVTVSAVLQPCCTCHMLFVLLARCVVCVLGK